MNARQKAKKYKRMYEELLKQPVNFKVERHKIDTLKFKRHYPTKLIVQDGSNYFRHCVVKDIAYSLAESLDKYINYHIEFCPDRNEYCFVGEIKVVSLENEMEWLPQYEGKWVTESEAK